MLTLAIDSSAGPVSVALSEGDKILGETFLNTKQTHSETLMPALQNMLHITGTGIDEIELLAVTNGPGSFTGVRIGISCVKGIAFKRNIPCIAISTLEAIAFGGICYEGKEICAVMDARRNQVYHGSFLIENGRLQRLCADEAISIEALYAQKNNLRDKLVLMGDGAVLCYETFGQCGAILAPEDIRYQCASSVALAAYTKDIQKEAVDPGDLTPFYLRMPQAERELKKRSGRTV